MAPGGSFHIPSFSTPPGGITRIGPRLGYLGSVRARAAHLAAVAAALIAPAVAEPRTIELELESGRTGGEVVRDRGAHGGRAVALTGRAGLRLRFLTGSTVASVVLRARRAPCSGRPRLSAALDGRRLGSRRVRSRRYRLYRFATQARAGSHVLRLALAGPRPSRSCRRRLLLDRLTLVMTALPRPTALSPPPLAAAPVPAPAPAAAPAPSPSPREGASRSCARATWCRGRRSAPR